MNNFRDSIYADGSAAGAASSSAIVSVTKAFAMEQVTRPAKKQIWELWAGMQVRCLER